MDMKRLAESVREERTKRRWTTSQLATLVREAAAKDGADISISQQTISGFEQGKAKREPSWMRYVFRVFGEADRRDFDEETVDMMVSYIATLPTYAGAGGGGTGEGEEGAIAVSRSLIEYELRAKATDILSVTIEGNSMDPDFQSGDQLLIDKRKTSVAQPGAFCLWDGDGYVVKYLEKVPGAEPAKIRVISRNQTYSTFERLVEEVRIMGRVVWFARRV